jgi:hypothetical protein
MVENLTSNKVMALPLCLMPALKTPQTLAPPLHFIYFKYFLSHLRTRMNNFYENNIFSQQHTFHPNIKFLSLRTSDIYKKRIYTASGNFYSFEY